MTPSHDHRTGLISSMLAPGEGPDTTATHGRGLELTLDDGTTVLDLGSLSSLLVGHCHPKVVEAIQRAADRVYVNDGMGDSTRSQAADDLLALAFADDPWADAVVLAVSSSEAGDLALMLAQMLTGESGLVCRELAYHGALGFAREVSVHPLWSAALVDGDGTVTPAPSGSADVRKLPVPDCGRGRTPRDHDCDATCLADADKLLDGAAAVIMDYTQGAVMPSPQFQDKLAERARRAGALWIADETVTGFGRLGHKFAYHRADSRPDIVQLGKGITGGAAPGGALVLSRDVVEALGGRRWKISSTFRGHPLTVAAVSATQRVIVEEGLVENAAELGRIVGPDIRSLVAHPSVETVVGEGLLWFIQLVVPFAQSEAVWYGERGATTPVDLVHEEAKRLGVFIPAYSGQSLWLIPPLIIDERRFRFAIEVLDQCLTRADERIA